VYFGFLCLFLAVFLFSLTKLVFAIGGLPEYLHFVFPGAVVTLLLLDRERSSPSVSSWSRFQFLLGMAAPFLLAVLLPVALFFTLYWYKGALVELTDGLFVAPFRRGLYARSEPFGLLYEYPAIMGTILLSQFLQLRGRHLQITSLVFTGLALALLLSARHNETAFFIILVGALGIIPVLSVATFLLLAGERTDKKDSSEQNQQLALVLVMMSLCSLIQFPFSHLIYFGYVVPFAVLVAANLASRLPRPPRIILGGTVAFFILFGSFILRPHYLVNRIGMDYDSTPLAVERATFLRVSKFDANEYNELIPYIKGIASNKIIVAGPDCPEIYFLTGMKNPTPVLFDFLHDSHEYERDMKSVMDQPNLINVAVINDKPQFSTDQLRVLRSLVMTRFPRSHKIGDFTVYWRP
jgi:hypothetical protein